MNAPNPTPANRYQRMDPQPGGSPPPHPPAELTGAEPWRASDGEWFWRMPITNIAA